MDRLALKSFINLLVGLTKQIWRVLTGPFDSLPQVEDYRRASVIAAFTLVSVIAIGIEQASEGDKSLVSFILLLIGYFLARTRWFRLATIILIFALSIPSYEVAITSPTPEPNRIFVAFSWMIIPLLLSSLIYSILTTVVIYAINMAAILALPFIRPELSFGDIGGAIGFYSVTSAILIIVMVQRNQMEKDRRRQLIESQELLSREVFKRNKFAEQAHRRANELMMVNHVNSAISNLQSLNSILHLIFEQVSSYIKLNVFFIALYDENSQTVSFPVLYDGGKFWEEPAKSIQQTPKVARVIETSQPLLWNRSPEEIEQARNSQNRLGDPKHVAASIVIVPLQAGPRRIGALSVQSYEQLAYNTEHISVLTAMAQQVTVAIENARLFEEANKQAQRLVILNEIGREISALSDLPTLMQTVYEQIEKTLPVNLFFIGLYDAAKNELNFPIMYDEGQRWEQPVKAVTQATFSGQTILNRAPLLINQWADTDQTSLSPRIIVGNPGRTTTSLMFAPMIFAGEVMGVISVQSYTPNAYTQEDLDLLYGIANQVAVAIQNTRLLEETQQNALYLSILNKVGRAVSELRDLPSLLDVIYEQVKQNLKVDAFYVGLYHLESDMVSYPISYDAGIRYYPEPEQVATESYLYHLLRGRGAGLTNRTPEELAAHQIEKNGMFGDVTRKSASLLIAPLKSGEQVIGVISTQSYTLNAYKNEDLELLVGIANQVSIAIENSRLYSEAQQEIAERRRFEEQLRAAEAKYRELVEHVPVVIYSSESGPAGRWFFVSPQIESLLGFTPEEWMADPNLWFQQIHPDDREAVINEETKALAAGSKVDMDYRMYTRNGSLLWIHDESLNVSISDNQQYVVQGILTDITLRKQAELDLKDSEGKYHTLFLTAERQARELSLLSEIQAAISRELSLSDLLHTVVESIAKIFGYTFVSVYILKNGLLKLQHQTGYESLSVIEQVSPWEGVLGRVVRSGQPVLIKDVSLDPDFLRADQNIMSEACVPLFDGDEIIGGLNVESSLEQPLNEDDLRLMIAVSEQINVAIRRSSLYAERAENLRREQHINEFAHALSSTLDLPNILEKVAKLSVDLVGADTAAVSIMSDDGSKMTNVYNYNEDPKLAATLPKGQGLTWATYEIGEPIIVDEYAEHSKALPEWSASGLHAFMGFPISSGRKRLGVLALYNRKRNKKFTRRDFTLMEAVAQEVAIAIQNARLFDALQKELDERKQIESEREAMVVDLEAKNAELERFTYTVSHDLKSPLVTIGGFLGFLGEDIKKGDERRIQSSLKRIHEATLKMRRLLDELLELSRIGRLANPTTEIPFGDLVGEALEMVEGELTARQVQTKVEADLPVVLVDRIRMVEVLQNLIVNATKFMGKQERPLIEIGMQLINNRKTFFVRDNGMGIAPEYHKKVFGLFDKLDPSSEGTGIGLAVVKRIIEVHDGRIWVESELGKGATFFFTLAEKN